MIQNSDSLKCLPPYTYVEPAVAKFPWSKKHKHSKKVQENQITINQVLSVQLVANNTINIQMCGTPIGSLVPRLTISDKFNTGPYIDNLGYSLEPLSKGKCTCLDDSVGGTEIHKFTQTTEQSQSTGFHLTAQGSHGKLMSGGSLGPSMTFSKSESTGYQSVEKVFNQVEHVRGEKKIFEIFMKNCLPDKYSNTFLPYDIEKIWTLRKSNLDTRIGFGIGVPFVGWFGGWKMFPDTLHSVPVCATTSIGAKWTVQYLLPPNESTNFEWTTEVRTVFATNDNRVAKNNDEKEYLNWIKTTHQITQQFKVSVDNEQKKVTLDHLSKKTQKLCSVGYEETTTSRSFINGMSEIDISEEKALHLFNTQI